MKKYIWYASYGSNLLLDRFKLYIMGGKAEYVQKDYHGCSRKKMPAEDDTYMIPYEIYFSQEVPFWNNGGAAFINKVKSDKAKTHCRIYKIRVDQFKEILQQENGISADHKKLKMDINDIIQNGFFEIGSPNEHRWYGRVIYLGHNRGLPIFTFTAKWDENEVSLNRPGDEYLKIICRGLIERFDFDETDCFNYLQNVKGIAGFIPTNELKEIISQAATVGWTKLQITGTDRREGHKGEFIVQINPSVFGKQISGKYLIIKKHSRKINALTQIDKSLDENTIRMDQKLRNAIGVAKGDNDEVFAILQKEKKSFVAKWFKKLFGIQYNIARVYKSTFTDMEINICRLSKECISSIGVNVGDLIKIESTAAEIKLRVYELSDSIEKQLKERREKMPDKFPTCAQIMKIEFGDSKEADLPQILLDGEARKKLRVKDCDPLRISRSIENDIVKQLHLLSIPLIIAIMAALIEFENMSATLKALILALGVVLVFILNFIDLKK